MSDKYSGTEAETIAPSIHKLFGAIHEAVTEIGFINLEREFADKGFAYQEATRKALGENAGPLLDMTFSILPYIEYVAADFRKNDIDTPEKEELMRLVRGLRALLED